MNKKLSDYTPEEWEAICNQCGKCCLIKIQDDETDEIYYTDVVCKYIDEKTLSIEGGKLLPLSPDKIYPCGNSGTTMRLVAGILSGQKFNYQHY